METFIVLGFCFILYEALDLFQSCYTNNNRHPHQQLQLTDANEANSITDDTETNDVPAANASSDANNVITTVPLRSSDSPAKQDSATSSESIYLCEDNVQLLNASVKSGQDYEFIDNVEEDDDEYNDDDDIDDADDDDLEDCDDDEDSGDSGNNQSKNVYSICDRVSQHNQHRLISFQ